MYFLENLRFLMFKHNLNRSQLARELSISNSTINNWYNRKDYNVTLQNLIKISDFFNVTLDDLIYCDMLNSNQNK